MTRENYTAPHENEVIPDDRVDTTTVVAKEAMVELLAKRMEQIRQAKEKPRAPKGYAIVVDMGEATIGAELRRATADEDR